MEVSSAVNRHGRRLPVRRAFVGLAGSPLASVITEPEPEPNKPAPLSNAERARLFRARHSEEVKKKDAERKRAERADERERRQDDAVWRRGEIHIFDEDTKTLKPPALVRAPRTETLKEFERKLSKRGLSVGQGTYGKGADRGQGLALSFDDNSYRDTEEKSRYKAARAGMIAGLSGMILKAYVLDASQGAFKRKGNRVVTDVDDWKFALMAILVDQHFTTVPAVKTIVSPGGDLIFEGVPETYLCRKCMFETEWPNDRYAHLVEEHDELIRSARYGRKKKAV